jgi:hypothetical protein
MPFRGKTGVLSVSAESITLILGSAADKEIALSSLL